MRPKKYFAAANGYNGFRSYFNDVFDSEKFDSVYVLKGGPGTGKSSLMKRIAEDARKNGISTEEIFCSSDPHSLDGVIIGEKCKVAIIDGTAPHERDAIFPGIIDEIINLGEGWNSVWLRAKRDKLFALAAQKKDAYRAAYSYLSTAGSCMKQIREATRLSVDGEMLKKEAKKLADEFAKDGEGVTDIALSGSFGKYGEYALNDYFTTSDRVIRLKGDKQIGQLIIKEVFDVAKLRGANCVISPDALDEHYINAIYFYDTDSAIAMTDTDDNGAISLDKFLKNEGVSDIHSEKRANELYRITMEEAKRFFSIASDMHFRLEEHYSEAMDFAYNERVYKKYSDIILEKCKNS